MLAKEGETAHDMKNDRSTLVSYGYIPNTRQNKGWFHYKKKDHIVNYCW